MSTRARRLLVTLMVLITVAGLGSAWAATPARRLPPPSRKALVKIFDPKIEDLGFRVTRARLQNLDTYEVDPEGEHLAVYLEPTGDDFTEAQYVSAFMETARVFLPMVFERWKGIQSFDVCLEPLPAEDARRSPPPVTQLLVTRATHDELDWETATLVDAIATANEYTARGGESVRAFYVYFTLRLDEVPELIAARETAEQR